MGLKYRAFFPPVGAPDVVYRELRVVVDGVESILRVSADKNSAELPVVGEGVRVGLAVRDTDDAGNTSEWSESCLLTISECHPSRQVHFQLNNTSYTDTYNKLRRQIFSRNSSGTATDRPTYGSHGT